MPQDELLNRDVVVGDGDEEKLLSVVVAHLELALVDHG
eukprot:CAMPEP_0197569902 /NCGR_PEP_ID=MMETSP1320-20131121/39763_1 /TAXON_ID=91990 /ORGANISM="Bolidomonas sp., Strain RCC2347" /LENGTH=37 /DNA_ID= /DNA_START= /DNA_END= /DNA_ORIENTATION=